MIPIRDELPTVRKPYVTVGLIALNCAVFLWQVTRPAPLQESGILPAHAPEPRHDAFAVVDFEQVSRQRRD